MASNRHLGRIIALQSLYEIGFRRECGDKSVTTSGVIKRNIGRYKATLDDKPFIEELVKGVDKSVDDLDKRIQPIAPDWPMSQIARVDHIVLLMGAYELINQTGVPPKVVINEAVELAKAYGGENSSKFINGVLGTLLREIDPSLAKKLDAEVSKKSKKVKAE